MHRHARPVAMLVCGIALLSSCSSRHDDRALVIVSNEDSGDLTIIDPTRDEVVQSITVGKRPRGMRVSRDGKTLYVALSGSPKDEDEPRDDARDGIGVVDLDRFALVRVLPAGRDPEAFDLTPDGRFLYVSNEDNAQVSVVDVATGSISRRIDVGARPEGVTISPDGARVYVTSEGDSAVDIIATRDDKVFARIPTGARPRTVALNVDGTEALVTAERAGKLQIFETKTRDRAPIGHVSTGDAGARPMDIAVAPDGEHAFVSNGREGSVAIVDLGSRRVERSVDRVGTRCWGLGLLPSGKKLYVAAGPDLAVIDTARGEVVKRIAVGRGPWGVAVARRAPP